MSWRYLRRTEGQEQPHTQRRGNSADNADASKDTFRVPDVFLLERDGWKGGERRRVGRERRRKRQESPERVRKRTQDATPTPQHVCQDKRGRGACAAYTSPARLEFYFLKPQTIQHASARAHALGHTQALAELERARPRSLFVSPFIHILLAQPSAPPRTRTRTRTRTRNCTRTRTRTPPHID